MANEISVKSLEQLAESKGLVLRWSSAIGDKEGNFYVEDKEGTSLISINYLPESSKHLKPNSITRTKAANEVAKMLSNHCGGCG